MALGIDRSVLSRRFSRTFRWAGRHADILAVCLILVPGLLARLVILDGAPVFLAKDSQSYFAPGWDLAHGLALGRVPSRVPVYLWFIAASLVAIGDQLRSVVLVQHVLGLVTALGTYWIGRLVFGRLVGLGAGLLTALSGPLLLYEHYILADALFGCLVVVGTALLLRGVRAGSLWWPALGGLVLGLAALARPAALLIPLAVPPVIWLVRGSWRAAVAPSVVFGAGVALAMLPWLLGVWGQDRTLSTSSMYPTMGSSLLTRTTQFDRGFVLPDAGLEPYSDPVYNEARRAVLRLIAKRTLPSDIARQLSRELGFPSAAARTVARDVPLEMIRAQPGYYALSTAGLTLTLFLGTDERLKAHWTNREGEVERWTANERISPLLPRATADQEAAFPGVDRAVSLYQPARFGPLLALLFVVGTLACLVRRSWRPGLLLSLEVAALLLTATLIAGAQWRYRYPADPFITILALAGAVAGIQWLLAGAARLKSALARPASGPSSQSANAEAGAAFASPVPRNAVER